MNNELKNNMIAALERLKNSRHAVALTGAGISVESGIPDFRSSGGLWEKFDPEIYASIDSFVRDPGRVWEMLLEMTGIIFSARPNAAHFALRALQERNLVHEIITQNIDGLHQAAGSSDVIEFHGNAMTLTCINCARNHGAGEFDWLSKKIPRCLSCGGYLKPDMVFFGEAIPAAVMESAVMAVGKADALIVIGTSATVFPAAAIPRSIIERGGLLIDINPEPTVLSRLKETVYLEGRAGDVMSGILALVEAEER